MKHVNEILGDLYTREGNQMARGINKVIIIGNVGQDPETHSFPDGGSVTNVTVATSESWKDKTTGEQKEKTEWHRVVFRDRGNFKLGAIAGEYLKKGSKVYVEGKLQTRQWEQDGVKRYSTEIIASEMQMLDSKQDNQGVPSDQARAAQPPAHTQAVQAAATMGQPATQAPVPAGLDNFDDDIPF